MLQLLSQLFPSRQRRYAWLLKFNPHHLNRLVQLSQSLSKLLSKLLFFRHRLVLPNR